jgi:hypothetical protein
MSESTPIKPCMYLFKSEWNLNAPVLTVWQTLTSTPFSWDTWWPELTDLKIIKEPSDLAGTEFSCNWSSPTGYKLQTNVVIDEVVPLRSVRLLTSGDLNGKVVCLIENRGAKTHVDIYWEVSTEKAWMNRLRFPLKPFFIWSHHAVMRSGQKNLQRYIDQNKKSPD